MVKLDLLLKFYIRNIADNLLDIIFKKTNLISENVKLEEIQLSLTMIKINCIESLVRVL